LSCTAVSTIYTIKHKEQSYEFPVGVGKSSVDNYEKWLDAICESTPKLEVGGNTFELLVLDTPGLNDTEGHGKDEENVISIIKALSNHYEPFITAVLFIVKNGTALSDTFQKIFAYYRQLLSAVSDRFIFVHTKWSPLREDIKKIDERSAVFNATLHGTFKHFYIDSVIDEERNPRKNPYPQVSKALTINTLNQILQYVHNLPPVEVRDLQFLKTPAVKTIHDKMRTHLDSVASGIQQSLEILNSDLQDINRNTTVFSNRKGTLTSLLSSAKEQIAKLDTDDLVKEGEDSVDNPYFFFSPLQKRELHVTCSYFIETATSTLGDRRCIWITELKFDDRRMTVTRTVESLFCGGIAGTLVAFVKSKVKYSKQLETIQKEQMDYQKELTQVVEQLSTLETSAMKKNTQIEQFAKRAEQAGIVSGKLYSNTMALSEYITTRSLFKLGDNYPVEGLVQEYCKLMTLGAEFLIK